MTKHLLKYFNVDVNNITMDYTLLVSNNNATIESETKSCGAKIMEYYNQKMNEYVKKSGKYDKSI